MGNGDTLDRVITKHDDEESPGRVIAEKVVAELEERHAAYYMGMVREWAITSVARMVADRRQAVRSTFRRHERHDQLNRSIASGEIGPYSINYTVGDGRNKLLEHMTANDCESAAEIFHRSARPALIEETFLRLVAKRTRDSGKRYVSGALSEQQLTNLRQKAQEAA